MSTTRLQAPKHILLIEDNKTNQLLMGNKKLKTLFPGSSIHIADNGKDAFDVFLEKNPEFIISDGRILGAQMGWDVVRKIRNHQNGRDTIIFSWSAEPDYKEQFEGLVDFMVQKSPQTDYAGMMTALQIYFDLPPPLIHTKSQEEVRKTPHKYRLTHSTGDLEEKLNESKTELKSELTITIVETKVEEKVEEKVTVEIAALTACVATLFTSPKLSPHSSPGKDNKPASAKTEETPPFARTGSETEKIATRTNSM